METKEKRPEHADLSRQAPGLARHTRGQLGRLMLTAFIGYAFMYFVAFFYILLVAKVFIPPIVIEAALVLLATVVVATRWRWARHSDSPTATTTSRWACNCCRRRSMPRRWKCSPTARWSSCSR